MLDESEVKLKSLLDLNLNIANVVVDCLLTVAQERMCWLKTIAMKRASFVAGSVTDATRASVNLATPVREY